MNDHWYTGFNVSNRHMKMLIGFYMAQQALSQALSEAKPLGICKTITSGKNPIKLSNLTRQVQTLLRPSTRSSIQSSDVSKEML